MHDKAHERFKELSLEDKHDFYTKLIDTYDLSQLKTE
jgi:hypothetical protein